mgnify:CR=1 FL=1
MANIAQLVNVLQSVILTDGARMVKTPTYFVFKMYADHQDAELVSSSLETKEAGIEEDNKVKKLYESCSVKDGKLVITLTNLSLDEDENIDIVLTEAKAKDICGEIVTGAMDDLNTFDAPDKVKTEGFDKFEKTESGLKVTVPAKSVLKLVVAL